MVNKNQHYGTYQMCTMKNLIHQAYNLSSSQFWQEHQTKFKARLKMNNYQSRLVNNVKNEFKHINKTSHENSDWR